MCSMPFVFPQAMVALKHERSNRGPMVQFLNTCADSLNETETCGAFRWWVTLKPGCKKVQLPLASKMLANCRRPPTPCCVLT